MIRRPPDPLDPYRTNWQQLVEWHHGARAIPIVFATLFALALYSWLAGTTARAVFVSAVPGPDRASVYLRTEPHAFYIMPRNASYHALRPGCRYDFNYDPHFGRDTVTSPKARRWRNVRHATLVDCPGLPKNPQPGT